MNVAMIVCAVVGIVLLILLIASKTMDILIGLLGTIAGVCAYIWLGTPDSYVTQLKWALDFQVVPSQLKTYVLVAIGVSIFVLIIGLIRGRKPQKVIVVEKEVAYREPTPAPNPTPIKPVETVKPAEPAEVVKPVEETEPVKEPESVAPVEEVKAEEVVEEKAEEVAENEKTEPKTE